MSTKSKRPATGTPLSPDSKRAWKARNDSGPHTAVFPSGAILTFRIPNESTLLESGRLPDQLREIALLCAAHPEGPEGYMTDLVHQAMFRVETQQQVTQAIEAGMQMQHHLVAEMLVDPTVTPDEVAAGEFPELDIRMLLEFAERRRNTDAVGNRLPVVVLRDWASFRDEPESAAGTGAGGEGGPVNGADVPDPDPVAV